MNYYKVVGPVTAKICTFLTNLRFKNILKIDLTSSNSIKIITKDDLEAFIKYIPPGSNCITWSIYDFESRAVHMAGEDWENEYQKSLFPLALKTMIAQHDASIGINWDVIDHYLEKYCKK